MNLEDIFIYILIGIVRSFPEVIVMDDISRIQRVYIELENIIKSIASWKRLVIMDELTKYEEGRSYTELRKAVELLSSQQKKGVRIDFHLEELRKINFLRKNRAYSLFQNQGRDVYKITYSGRVIQSFVSSLLEKQLFFTSPKEGLVYHDQIYFPRTLDLNSLVLIMDIAREFERVQTLDDILLYWIISEKIQRYPPLINLIITIEFIDASIASDPSKEHEMKILAYWSKEAMRSAAKDFGIPPINDKESFLLNSKLQNGLIFMIQQALSRVRDIIYDLDAISAKSISDKIFEYLNANQEFISKSIQFID